jgi:hypothetical protein
MKKLMRLSLVTMVAVAFCASAHAGWQLQYIRDAAGAFTPGPANAWFVNWVSNYPVFYLRKQAQNGNLTLRIKGVTYERFSYYMNSDIANAFLKLTTAADPPVKLEVKLSPYFLIAPPFEAPQMDVTWQKFSHGAQPNISIIVTPGGTMPSCSLGNINIYYGRPALSANNVMTFPANWYGYVRVDTDGGFKMLNVFGGIVYNIKAKSNIGAIYVRRVKHAASGIIYGGILGGAAGHTTADIYTKGTIGYIFANGGLGSALRNGVPAVQEPTVCSGWDGAAVYPSGIATIVAPSGGLNSQISAGSGPVIPIYGAAIRTILLGNQNAGVLTTSKFYAGPKPKIAGPGKALAVGSTVETSLGSIPINAAY